MRVKGFKVGREQRARVDRRAVLTSFLGLGGLGLAGCSPIPGGYRYKIVVEIEVDGRRYVGQGVRETVTRDQLAFPNQGVLGTRQTRGEAFWIDVPGKPTLFIILPGYDGAFTSEWNPNLYLTGTRDVVDGSRHYAVVTKLKEARLSPDQLPGLVYFKNIADSGSGEFLKPADFSKVYGPGARIVGASVMRSHEPLTRGIRKKIPWFSNELKKFKWYSSIYQSPNRYIFSVTQFYSWGWM